MNDRPPAAPPAAFDEVRIFIDPDGTVTICDLWEGLLPVAEALGEVEAPPSCPLPSPAGAPAADAAPGVQEEPAHPDQDRPEGGAA